MTVATAAEPAPRERKVQRVTRWKRVITITGDPEWVERTRSTSLTIGLHLAGTLNGVPCTIEVESDEGEHLRFLPRPTPNKAMTEMRLFDPEEYERVHGPGTAIEHADHAERRARYEAASPKPPTTSADTHVGQYL